MESNTNMDDHEFEKQRKLSSIEVDSKATAKKFTVAVDSDNKAKELKLYSFGAPHMRAFHLSWFSFFACFVSTFAAPPLLPVIRDNLNLTATDIGNAGIASVSGAIFARLVMGTACDLFGPRLASAILILATTPPVYFTAIISGPTGFLVVRFMTGFSLASFVSTQFWMSSMFSATKVGAANGFAGGWGNLGGGATQLIMPLVFHLIQHIGSTRFTAWRVSFFIPGIIQTVSALAVLWLGTDMPDGNYKKLQKSGDMHKDNFNKVLWRGVRNYRAWILAFTYGYCFGVELAVDNIIAEYYFDRFHLNLRIAGMIAASFGLANVVTRPGGGFFSDYLSKRFGMRGRLWGLWSLQTLGGVFCVILGRMDFLAGSVAVMLIFSFFVQAACGMTFGVVPFVSRRALGLVSGMTGGGGNLGAVVTQLLFFKGTTYAREDGIMYMGIMIICCTLPICFIHFPMWGGMFTPPSKTATEQDYYISEWDEKEIAKGYHIQSLNFAANSITERGDNCKSEIVDERSPTTITV